LLLERAPAGDANLAARLLRLGWPSVYRHDAEAPAPSRERQRAEMKGAFRARFGPRP
jgi:hypothetical protein